SENNWIEWFNTYLPKRYHTDKAFVIDSNDKVSEQIDIVIYDMQYSHLVFQHQGAKYIPAESVYAVFEVKQEINKEHLDYAVKKAESVRRLKRTSTPIKHAGGTYHPKPLHDIIAGILTLTSSWKEPLGESLKKNLLQLPLNNQLQLGCVVQEGAFSLKDDGSIEISGKQTCLVSFFFNLLLRLQSIGTVPAIDIQRYAKILSSNDSAADT
ncbi:MAG: hypothetical protein LBF13_00640, partial [Campylobacteraceae bacterium]|nr:hypothetical protein [Campylobacteraceae bacterium]